MEQSRLEFLQRIALQRLEASADDEERWSYAWGGEGAVDFSYCPWAAYEDEEFWGVPPGIKLPWPPERIEQLESGEEDPNEAELRQWRKAMCRLNAENGEAFVAWITPMRNKMGAVEAYALWLFSVQGAPEDPPVLDGIFDTCDDAKAKLRSEGYLKES
jgi:hypothetical protein